MKINRYNYETFLIDYLDEKLKPSMVAELLLFLEQNQDIQNELEGLTEAVLADETIIYPNKPDLKKKSFQKNGIDDEFEYLCIASVEDILNEAEKSLLHKNIAESPEKLKYLKVYQKSAIEPDETITFPFKSSLKRTSIIPFRHSTVQLMLRIVASITILIGTYSIGKLLFNDNKVELIPKNNILISSNLPISSSNLEKTKNVNSNNDLINKSKLNEKKVNVVPIKDVQKANLSRVESIPYQLDRIEPGDIQVRKDLQQEQLDLIATIYTYKRPLPQEQFRAQQEINDGISRTKEIGVFEIIQYGVQSFGKLIGKDIKLIADKDKKGNIDKISFESHLIAFSTPVRKKEPSK